MTIDQYRTAVAETANYTDRDAYISDLARSTIWGDAQDADIPTTRLEELGQIWDAAHRSVRQILADAGLSQIQFAKRFLIPLRTVENWCGERHACTIYDRMMFQQLMGLLRINIKEDTKMNETEFSDFSCGIVRDSNGRACEIEAVDAWWNAPVSEDMLIYKIGDSLICANGWNGLSFTNSFRVSDRYTAVDNAEISLTPIYRWQDEKLEMSEIEENSDMWDAATEVIGFSVE